MMKVSFHLLFQQFNESLTRKEERDKREVLKKCCLQLPSEMPVLIATVLVLAFLSQVAFAADKILREFGSVWQAEGWVILTRGL